MKNDYIKKIFTAPIRWYQILISPLLPKVCRYTPTCSQYMIDAINLHGIFKGIYLGTKRILRCHPWSEAKHDPVPPSKSKNSK